MTKTMHFKSKKDGKEFEIRVPETSEDIENNEFIEINGRTVIAKEILFDDPDSNELSEKVPVEGEVAYSVDEIYDLYYYNGEFYDFYWDTASGCIFSRLKEW
jgi:hypothetical protein